MSTKERIIWIDWAKVLLIYFVVVGHAGLTGIVQDVVYSFHMPAFFIISGFLYHSQRAGKTLRCFIIPIVVFSVINLCYELLTKTIKGEIIDWNQYCTMSWQSYFEVVASSDGYITLFTGVWFIMVLLLCRLLLGDIPKISFFRKYYKEVAAIMIAWVVVEPFFLKSPQGMIQDIYVYRILVCFPFMAVGIYFQTHNEWINKVLTFKWTIFIPLCLLFIGMTLRNGCVVVWNNTLGENNIVFFVNACLGSFILFRVCSQFKRIQIIEKLSRGTLLILGLHPICISISCNICRAIKLYPSPLFPWITGLVTLAICYYPIVWSQKHCPWLIGK